MEKTKPKVNITVTGVPLKFVLKRVVEQVRNTERTILHGMSSTHKMIEETDEGKELARMQRAIVEDCFRRTTEAIYSLEGAL